MPRPCKRKRVCQKPVYEEVIIKGSNSNEVVNLTIDEFECLRLLDYEQLTQEECAIKMNVARTTITSFYQEARYKIMDALVNGKRIVISGGNYELCSDHQDLKGYKCLTENKIIKERKESVKMRIAVTHANGEIFQHFGRCEQFKVYDVEEDQVVESFIVESNGVGHGALAGVLEIHGVDVLICGGIGNGAINALASCCIKVLAGASGNCDEIVDKFIKNELYLSGQSNCHHHEHEEEHECHCGGHGHHEEEHECHCGGHGHHGKHDCGCH